jgi:hypothetical protein
MGAFHDGHVELFRTARASCDIVEVSLFVNPTQFSDPGDLAGYPRDESRDARIAADNGVDMLFAPSVNDMYPPDYATWIEVEGPARGLEGEFRPGHFRGVATVCLKLFTIVRPHVAFFGQKDAQQVAVIKRIWSWRSWCAPRSARLTASRCRREMPAFHPASAPARSRFRAPSRLPSGRSVREKIRSTPPARSSPESTSTT